jgi:hypothetical protein
VHAQPVAKVLDTWYRPWPPLHKASDGDRKRLQPISLAQRRLEPPAGGGLCRGRQALGKEEWAWPPKDREAKDNCAPIPTSEHWAGAGSGERHESNKSQAQHSSLGPETRISTARDVLVYSRQLPVTNTAALGQPYQYRPGSRDPRTMSPRTMGYSVPSQRVNSDWVAQELEQTLPSCSPSLLVDLIVGASAAT